MNEYTMVLRGPLNVKPGLEAALAGAGHGMGDRFEIDRGHYLGFPHDDVTLGWVTVLGELEHAVEIAAQFGWQLVCHWLTPNCKVCLGRGTVADDHTKLCGHCKGKGRTNREPPTAEQTISDLMARVAALEAAR